MEFINHIRSGHLDPLKDLLEKSPELVNKRDERGFTPLVLATYLDQKEAAELLIDHGAEVNAQDALGNTALMGVCFKGSYELAEMLISRGADIHLTNNEGVDALSLAKNHNQEKIIELLQTKA